MIRRGVKRPILGDPVVSPPIKDTFVVDTKNRRPWDSVKWFVDVLSKAHTPIPTMNFDTRARVGVCIQGGKL